MKLEIDDDVRVVAEFMQRNVPAEKLVVVAEAMGAIAPLLWPRSRVKMMPLRLAEIVPISSGVADLGRPPSAIEPCDR